MAMVIGPTPPGTGVMKLAFFTHVIKIITCNDISFSAVSSATRGDTYVNTTAPSFTISAFR
jgi:hypothetical protein